jgi:tetratricopeptide (TPR) repeat protein
LSYRFGEEQVIIRSSAVFGEDPLTGTFTGAGHSILADADRAKQMVRRGRQYYEQGRLHSAERALKTATEIDPRNNEAWYFLDRVRRELISAKELGPLRGFRSKKGRPFTAVLKMTTDCRVTFDFGDDSGEERRNHRTGNPL